MNGRSSDPEVLLTRGSRYSPAFSRVISDPACGCVRVFLAHTHKIQSIYLHAFPKKYIPIKRTNIRVGITYMYAESDTYGAVSECILIVSACICP